MARGINKVILVGNLGNDPDVRYTGSGSAVANITLATSFKSGADKEEKTEWHRVVFFGKVAEIAAEYLHKGSQVYIEGRLQTRKWEDKEGKDRYTTEVVAHEMQMLGGRGQEEGQRSAEKAAPAPKPAEAKGNTHEAADDFDDDIPF